MRRTVTRTYLEMRSATELRPFGLADDRLRIERLEQCAPPFYRSLYEGVGGKYHWIDRLGWTDEQIRAHLARPELSLWVLFEVASPAGYFELTSHDDGSVEIAYFGLLDRFIGRGLGKHLLSVAAERAWSNGANRVWLHTSSLDHPAALSNYIKRGFTPFKAETYEVDIGAELTRPVESVEGF